MEAQDLFKPPLLQSRTKPRRWQGKTRCGSISQPRASPPALQSSGDERSPWHGVDALPGIRAELVAVPACGSRRSRAIPSGLPSWVLQEYSTVSFPLPWSSVSS